ncbi:ATP-dependent Clp protease adaptor ClpS [Salmonella enterica subsp. enterica]|nr:ATP-dependent Clp protease adaptor ClpS [Salmonella enterica subsp. enterica]
MYKVMIVNDYTPMSLLLTCYKFFSYDVERAAQLLMLAVHYQRQSYLRRVYRQLAETKVAMVNKYARNGIRCCVRAGKSLNAGIKLEGGYYTQ